MCKEGSARVPTVDMWDTAGPGLAFNGSQSCTQAAQAGCTYQDEVRLTRKTLRPPVAPRALTQNPTRATRP
jgi:hypothetical protein